MMPVGAAVGWIVVLALNTRRDLVHAGAEQAIVDLRGVTVVADDAHLGAER